MSDYLSPIPGPAPMARCAWCREPMYAEDGVTMHHPTRGDLEYCVECAYTYCALCGSSRQEVWDAGTELVFGPTVLPKGAQAYMRCKGGCPPDETNEQGGETVAQMTETPVTDNISNLVETMKARDDAEMAVLRLSGEIMHGLIDLLTVALGGKLPEKSLPADLGPDPADPEAVTAGRTEGRDA